MPIKFNTISVRINPILCFLLLSLSYVAPITVKASCELVFESGRRDPNCGSGSYTPKPSKSNNTTSSSSSAGSYSSGGSSSRSRIPPAAAAGIAGAAASAVFGIVDSLSNSSSGSSSSSSYRRPSSAVYQEYLAKQQTEQMLEAQKQRQDKIEVDEFDSEYNKMFKDDRGLQGTRVAANRAAGTNDKDIAGDCEEAQSRGGRQAQDIERSAKVRGPSICASARDEKQLGQIMVEVAEACKNLPDWKTMRSQGQQQIRESERVIMANCAK